MKKYLFFVCLCAFLLVLSSGSIAEENYGTLKVFTEIKGSVIYIDGKWAGEDTVIIKNIEVGTHYVRVEDSGRVYFSKIIKITEGETESVLVKAGEIIPDKAKGVERRIPKVGRKTATGVSSYFCFYGSSSFLSLSETASGITINYGYEPAFGIGLEWNNAVEGTATGANVGVNYNFPSKVTLSGFSGGTTIGISNIYANIVRNVGRSNGLEMNVGFGLNLSFWSLSTISSAIGYQGYYEFLFPSQDNHYSVKVGYEVLGGTAPGSTQSSSGLFLKGGYAYK